MNSSVGAMLIVTELYCVREMSDVSTGQRSLGENALFFHVRPHFSLGSSEDKERILQKVISACDF